MYRTQNDITTIAAPAIIAHGVNCQNVMGSGVAKALYTKWPLIKERYLSHDTLPLGGVEFVRVEEDPDLVVANCYTQEYYGRDGRKYANPKAVEEALIKVAEQTVYWLQHYIYIPEIGCGLGGLNFDDDVAPILDRIEGTFDVKFIVCVL